MKSLSTWPLPARTLFLILAWEIFIFGPTVIPFAVTAHLAPPVAIMAALAILGVLLGMHQALDMVVPSGSSIWERLRNSSRPVRAIYGPAVYLGWLLERLFHGVVLGPVLVIAAPVLLVMFSGSAWRQHRLRRALQKQGRLLEWRQALPLAEQGRGFLLVELLTTIEDLGWLEVNPLQLWWVAVGDRSSAVWGLPTYHQWLTGSVSGTEVHERMQHAFREYQAAHGGTASLVPVPRSMRKKIQQFLAEEMPEEAVRVTWVVQLTSC